MSKNILRENPVARTPVAGPAPGRKYEHLKHGVVTVTRVEDGMVVFRRPDDNSGHAYLNDRQQPVAQFRAQTVDIQ